MKKIQKTFLILLLILFNFSGRIFAASIRLRLFDIPKEYTPNLPLIRRYEEFIKFLTRHNNNFDKPTEEEMLKAREYQFGIDQRLAHKKNILPILAAFNNITNRLCCSLDIARIIIDRPMIHRIEVMIRAIEDFEKSLNLI